MHNRFGLKISVLVVDDCAPMQKLLRVLLTNYGATEIVEADNGCTALEVLQGRSFDLIITVVAMRPMDGLEFSRQIRKPGSRVSSKVPVLMISSHSDLPTIKAALDAGVTEFLVKPITSANFYLRLDEALLSTGSHIQADDYTGPDRRRLGNKLSTSKRRKVDAVHS